MSCSGEPGVAGLLGGATVPVKGGRWISCSSWARTGFALANPWSVEEGEPSV